VVLFSFGVCDLRIGWVLGFEEERRGRGIGYTR
jgi:hypothetical protein